MDAHDPETRTHHGSSRTGKREARKCQRAARIRHGNAARGEVEAARDGRSFAVAK
jgi:hypothetical protein